MRRALLFALSVVLLTLPLTWLWLHGGGALYAEWMTPVAREIYDLLGIQGRGTMRRMRFINLIPFTALVLLTPGLGWRRRLGGLAIGWVVLAASHVALNGLAMASRARGQLPPVAALASDAMPFVLWLLLARDFVAETMRAVRRGPEGLPADPGEAEPPSSTDPLSPSSPPPSPPPADPPADPDRLG